MDKSKIKTVMHEFKHGELHSGSKHGPLVTDKQQAIAISLREAGVPPRMTHNAHGGGMPIKKHPKHHMGYSPI